MIILYLVMTALVVVLLLKLLQRYTSVEFVGHARLLWRTWSVRLGVIATGASALLVYFPDAVLHAWATLPPDVKDMIPPGILRYIPTGLMVATVASQYIRQKKLRGESDADNTGR